MASEDEPLSIRQLEVFVTLVEAGSFTKAARRLELSQSTVSGHVADLESRVGVRLVGRERSGIRPTAAGEELLGPARDILRAERQARITMSELGGLLRGQVVIGASTIPGEFVLPALIARFREIHPAVRVRVHSGDSHDVVEGVRTGSYELAIAGRPASSRSTPSEQLGSDHVVFITSPSHPLATRPEVRVEDLADQPFVVREPGSGTRAALEQELQRRGLEQRRVVCEVGTTAALKAVVRTGIGVAFVSHLAIEDELRLGVLARSTLAGGLIKREFHLVTAATRNLSPAAQAFAEVARQSAAELFAAGQQG